MSETGASINFLVWRALVQGLRHRGGGTRESGAFLLGRKAPGIARVRAVAYYDDLDPHALDHGYILFTAAGYSALWTLCRRLDLDAIADVHTHPGPGTSQSQADRTNPMIAEPGHLALILPCFATTAWWSRNGASLYEYTGNHGWRNLTPRLADRFRITVF